MASSTTASTAPWAMVLAGGEGTRIRPLIRDWLGHDRPKQYCTFVGDRSLLQHTLDRVRDVAPKEQALTVIGAHHRCFLQQALSDAAPGGFIAQPVNRGTAPEVFLPATRIMEEDPEATVLILPSDHFIRPTARFLDHLRVAIRLVAELRDHVVLLGAVPDGPASDYGWIVPKRQPAPAPSPHRQVPVPRPVASFHRKPSVPVATRLAQRDGLWNTMITVVRVRTLWRLGWQHLPAMMGRFETLRQVVRAVREGECHRRTRPSPWSTSTPTSHRRTSRTSYSRAAPARCSSSPWRASSGATGVRQSA